ncbi:SDR family NAD(P)-dependent oxidoreductase [Streptomyces sp. NPDC087901]|uniref:SDR family NAD(P)-dependent oxidoreductase n=1 Tax=Streptomyces sp. NPDC087901 TaxID=3365818 RepID=UPI0037F36D0E
MPLTCDITDENQVKAALDSVIQTFGRLDVAFNGAGVEQPVQPIGDLTKETWDRVLGVNVTGTFLCMKHQIPLMLQQGAGAIAHDHPLLAPARQNPITEQPPSEGAYYLHT